LTTNAADTAISASAKTILPQRRDPAVLMRRIEAHAAVGRLHAAAGRSRAGAGRRRDENT
jgi:hypothetical protein